MINEREYWRDQVEGVLECYSDAYAEELKLDELTEDDMINLTDRVMNSDYLWTIIDANIQQIIEEYCNRKNA